MSAPKHTPGPWSAYREGNWHIVMAGGKAGRIVANVNGESCSDASSAPPSVIMPGQENAHLIAAAPELLECLEEMFEAMTRCEVMQDGDIPPSHGRMMRNARAAIAKAKGES